MLYLVGIGKLTIVDIDAGTTRVVKAPRLGGCGEPIVRRGDRLVLSVGDEVYSTDLDASRP